MSLSGKITIWDKYAPGFGVAAHPLLTASASVDLDFCGILFYPRQKQRVCLFIIKLECIIFWGGGDGGGGGGCGELLKMTQKILASVNETVKYSCMANFNLSLMLFSYSEQREEIRRRSSRSMIALHESSEKVFPRC